MPQSASKRLVTEAALLAYAPPSAGSTTVEHGTNANAARPTGAGFVAWLGSVQPLNAIRGDQWVVVPSPFYTDPLAALPWVSCHYANSITGLSDGAAVSSWAGQGSGPLAMTPAATAPVFKTASSLMGGQPAVRMANTPMREAAIASPFIAVPHWAAGVVSAAPHMNILGGGVSSHVTDIYTGTTNWAMLGGPTSFNGPVPDSNLHVVIGIWNGATSRMIIDGIEFTGATSATATRSQFGIGDRAGGTVTTYETFGDYGICGWGNGIPTAAQINAFLSWAAAFYSIPGVVTA